MNLSRCMLFVLEREMWWSNTRRLERFGFTIQMKKKTRDVESSAEGVSENRTHPHDGKLNARPLVLGYKPIQAFGAGQDLPISRMHCASTYIRKSQQFWCELHTQTESFWPISNDNRRIGKICWWKLPSGNQPWLAGKLMSLETSI